MVKVDYHLTFNKIKHQLSERLLGMTNQALYKSLGRTNLRWSVLEEVLLDFETNMNNRPLTYIEEDILYPILIPNSMVLGRGMIEDKQEDLGW